MGLRNSWLSPLHKPSLPKKALPEYDTELHLMVRLLFLKSEEYGVPFIVIALRSL